MQNDFNFKLVFHNAMKKPFRSKALPFQNETGWYELENYAKSRDVLVPNAFQTSYWGDVFLGHSKDANVCGGTQECASIQQHSPFFRWGVKNEQKCFCWVGGGEGDPKCSHSTSCLLMEAACGRQIRQCSHITFYLRQYWLRTGRMETSGLPT